jgi:hypothetical protein
LRGGGKRYREAGCAVDWGEDVNRIEARNYKRPIKLVKVIVGPEQHGMFDLPGAKMPGYIQYSVVILNIVYLLKKGAFNAAVVSEQGTSPFDRQIMRVKLLSRCDLRNEELTTHN